MSTLAQLIKAKYPGVYDDIPDLDLEAKINAKYPGVYDDLPKTPNRGMVPDTPSMRAAAGLPKPPSANPLSMGWSALKGAGNAIKGGLELLGKGAVAGASMTPTIPGINSEGKDPSGLTSVQKEFNQDYVAGPMEEQRGKGAQVGGVEGAARQVAGHVPIAGPAIAGWAEGVGDALGTGDLNALSERAGEALAPKIGRGAARAVGAAGRIPFKQIGQVGAAVAGETPVVGPMVKRMAKAGKEALHEGKVRRAAEGAQSGPETGTILGAGDDAARAAQGLRIQETARSAGGPSVQTHLSDVDASIQNLQAARQAAALKPIAADVGPQRPMGVQPPKPLPPPPAPPGTSTPVQPAQVALPEAGAKALPSPPTSTMGPQELPKPPKPSGPTTPQPVTPDPAIVAQLRKWHPDWSEAQILEAALDETANGLMVKPNPFEQPGKPNWQQRWRSTEQIWTPEGTFSPRQLSTKKPGT